MTMHRMALALLILSLGFFGCDVKSWLKMPSGVQTAAEKPKEAILAEVRPIIEPFRAAVNAVPSPEAPGLTDAQCEEVLGKLRDAQAQYGAMSTGAAAFKELAYEIADIAKKARDNERWRLVEACVDAHQLLNMQSVTLQRLDARAKMMLARPTVELKGFLEDKGKGETYVFLQITDHVTQTRKTVKVREGEEFNDLRLIGIIGNNKGVKLEYLKIEGLFFEIETSHPSFAAGH
jgi:hypothetical protein